MLPLVCIVLLYLVYFDFSGAFDRVNDHSIFEKLPISEIDRRLFVPNRFFVLIRSLTEQTGRSRFLGHMSRYICDFRMRPRQDEIYAYNLKIHIIITQSKRTHGV